MITFTHDIFANIVDCTCKMPSVIDIHQGDSNSHTLLFHIVDDNGKGVEIDSEYTLSIEFYSSTEGTRIATSSVTIDNYYRGLASYTLGESIVSEADRYTTYLKLKASDDTVVATMTFVIVISKSHDFESENDEKLLTLEEYNEIIAHLANTDIHVTEDDHDILALVSLLELPTTEESGLDITTLASGTYITENDGYIKCPPSTLTDHSVPVRSLLLKNAILLVRNDLSEGFKCNVLAHRRSYSIVKEPSAGTEYYTYFIPLDASVIETMQNDITYLKSKIDEE